MKKILTYIIPFVLLCLFVDNATSEDMPEKLSQLSPDWNKTNTLDKEIFVQQQKQVSTIISVSSWGRLGEECLTEIFWGYVKKTPEIGESIDRNQLMTISIPGYVSDYRDWPPHPLWWFFRVEVSCFNNLFLSNILNQKDPKGSCIQVHMQSFDNHVEAKKLALTCIPVASRSTLYFVSLYKIDQSPGDACLVYVDRPNPDLPPKIDDKFTFTDRSMLFVRGNVAVYLTSSYENFGCMDLACRIDAWLVEQMKRQSVTEKEKEAKK